MARCIAPDVLNPAHPLRDVIMMPPRLRHPVLPVECQPPPHALAHHHRGHGSPRSLPLVFAVHSHTSANLEQFGRPDTEGLCTHCERLLSGTKIPTQPSQQYRSSRQRRSGRISKRSKNSIRNAPSPCKFVENLKLKTIDINAETVQNHDLILYITD